MNTSYLSKVTSCCFTSIELQILFTVQNFPFQGCKMVICELYYDQIQSNFFSIFPTFHSFSTSLSTVRDNFE